MAADFRSKESIPFEAFVAEIERRRTDSKRALLKAIADAGGKW